MKPRTFLYLKKGDPLAHNAVHEACHVVVAECLGVACDAELEIGEDGEIRGAEMGPRGKGWGVKDGGAIGWSGLIGEVVNSFEQGYFPPLPALHAGNVRGWAGLVWVTRWDALNYCDRLLILRSGDIHGTAQRAFDILSSQDGMNKTLDTALRLHRQFREQLAAFHAKAGAPSAVVLNAPTLAIS